MNRRRFLTLAAATALFGPDVARAAGSLLAVATCDLDAHLAVVDVRSGRVARLIPCLPDPRSIERIGGGNALVCHTAEGAVSIVDGSALAVRHVLRSFVEPRYSAVHPNGRHVYVTDSGTREVVAVDAARGRTLGRLKLDGWARHITVDPSGTRLWVALGSAAEHVAVVDLSNAASPRLVRNVRPPFLAHDVGFGPAGATVWVTSGEASELALYDRHGRLHRRLGADAPPQHVTFGGGIAYVTSGTDGTLRALAPDGRELASRRVPIGSYNVQFGHGLVLTASLDAGTLCVLDGDVALVREVRVASSSHDACFLGAPGTWNG